ARPSPNGCTGRRWSGSASSSCCSSPCWPATSCGSSSSSPASSAAGRPSVPSGASSSPASPAGPAPPGPRAAPGGRPGPGGGAAAEAVRVVVKEVRVPLRRLPPALDGMTIAQITDLHIGPTLGRAFLEDVVARVNAIAPDVIAITGDLVDASPAEIGDAVSVLAELRAPHGVFFVTGNHEYYAGVAPWLDFLAKLGIRVLRNEPLSIGSAGPSFALA